MFIHVCKISVELALRSGPDSTGRLGGHELRKRRCGWYCIPSTDPFGGFMEAGS